MTTTRPVLAALFVLAIFVAGIVTGGALVVVGMRVAGVMGARGDDGGPGPHGPHDRHGPPHGPPHGPHDRRGPPHGPHDDDDGDGPGSHRGPPPPERIVEMLRDRIGLDDGQAAATLAVVREQEDAVQQAHAAARPAIEAALQRGEDRIRALLRPEQLPAFERVVQDRRAHVGVGPPPR